MGDQGGEPHDEQHKEERHSVSTNYVNSKIAITAIIGVIFGAVFVIVLVLLGIKFSKEQPHTDTPAVEPVSETPVLETIKVDYEEIATSYNATQTRPDGSLNSLMTKYGIDDAEYAILRSSEELDDFVATINSMSVNNSAPFIFSLGEDFFKTSSVIAIAKEDAGLETVSIDDVYRDENYNIHICAKYASPNDTTHISGKVIFLQIQNIQPKTVEVAWNQNNSVEDPFVDPGDVTEKKPIIYLYPEQTTMVSVKLSNPERITVDYPNYNNGWQVSAQPDGTLTTAQGKRLYALYYESKNIKKYNASSLQEGFVVARDDVEDFLDAKLKVLGLNYKESEEFISYWAGVLEAKPYVFIRFQTATEIERNMGLIVSPKPDTTIRIMMEYRPLDAKISTKPQQLTPAEHKGFTVVEWGGTEIK